MIRNERYLNCDSQHAVMIGIVIAAIVAIQAKKVITSVIALDVTGSLAALEFLLLQAPDVAIAEASVGVVLTTVLYIVALRKVKEEDDA